MRAHANHFASIPAFFAFFLFLVPGYLRADTGTDYERRTAITVESPTAVAVDSSENVYVAESSKNRVQIFDYAGVFLGEIAGLAKPLSVAVDENGRIYIGNDNSNNVEVYDPARNLLFKLGQGDGEFLKPNGIAIDDLGNIYVADSDADLIKVYNNAGTAEFTFGGTGSGVGKFNFPTSLAIDTIAQEIFVSDRQEFSQPGYGVQQGARIQVFDMNGGYKRSFTNLYGQGDGKLTRPVGVTVDRTGLIYASDSLQNVAQIFDSTGAFVKTLYNLDNPLRTPLGLTVSHQTDKVYIASLQSHRVDIYSLAHAHVVNVIAGVGGTISPLGEQTVSHGDFVDFAITPEPGYYLNQVLVSEGLEDSIPLDTPQKQFRLAIIDDLTVEALFAREISAADPTPLNIVKPATYVPGEPTTYPLLAGSGETHTFHAAGGSGTYNWSVLDADGNVICSQYAIGEEFTVNIDDLFAHGAGVYKVVLIDVNDPGVAAILYVRVPMRISPLFGNHKDTDGTIDLSVSGASGTFSWSLTDENGETITDEDSGVVITDPSFGTLPPETGTASNTLSLTPGVIDNVTTFLVQVRIDDMELADAELDTVVSDPHTIMPVMPFTVQINDAVDSAPLVGATVIAAHDQSISADTDAEGRATLSGLVNTGANYTFFVYKNGYLPTTFTANDLEIVPPAVYLEPVTGAAVISGVVDPPGTCTLVKAMGPGGGYFITSSGSDVQVLANEVSGEFTLTLDNSQAGPDGQFTIVANRPGYIEGTVEAIADDTGKVIILQKLTRIAITNDGADPNLTFTITADPPFNGTPGEIQVFNGTSAVVANEVAGALLSYDNAAHSYTYTVAAPAAGESVSIFVHADTTSSRTAASGYFATASTTYVPGLTPSAKTTIINPHQGSTTAAVSSSGKASVVLPAGGLDGEILSEVTVAIDEADALTAGIPFDNWSEIFAVTLTDTTTGEKIDNAILHKIYITLKFDPQVVEEGGFEAGTWVIYHADSLTDLQAGNASVVPVTQIVKPIDYASGRVTFWVDHLSVFGVGSVSGGGSSASAGGGGGCFIDTSFYRSNRTGFYRAVILLGFLLATLLLLLKTRRID
jgi:hypothetical protein